MAHVASLSHPLDGEEEPAVEAAAARGQARRRLGSVAGDERGGFSVGDSASRRQQCRWFPAGLRCRRCPAPPPHPRSCSPEASSRGPKLLLRRKCRWTWHRLPVRQRLPPPAGRLRPPQGMPGQPPQPSEQVCDTPEASQRRQAETPAPETAAPLEDQPEPRSSASEPHSDPGMALPGAADAVMPDEAAVQDQEPEPMQKPAAAAAA